MGQMSSCGSGIYGFEDEVRRPLDGNVRHLKRKLSPYGPISPSVALGAGCYWGCEKFIKKDFQRKFPNSILKAKVGFMSVNNTKRNSISHSKCRKVLDQDLNSINSRDNRPTYDQISLLGESNTEYIEVLYLTLTDPQQHFEELIRFFFTFHDPTTLGRQGKDVGFQYSSVIFFENGEQARIAKMIKEELNFKMKRGDIDCYEEPSVVTRILPSNIFYPAKKEHQEYLMKNPDGYCNHFIRFRSWKTPNRRRNNINYDRVEDERNNGRIHEDLSFYDIPPVTFTNPQKKGSALYFDEASELTEW